MSFPSYESYCESGVEWLGELPAHWSVKRLRFVARLNPSKRQALAYPPETEFSFLPMEAVGEKGEFSLEHTRPVNEVANGYTFFADGDVLFAKVTPCFENGKGALVRGLVRGMGFGTTELTVIRALDATDADFLWWLTVSKVFRGPAQAEMVGAGGLKRVPDEFVADFPVPRPPKVERDAIVAFLFRETAKIDALAALSAGALGSSPSKGTLLALLEERRSALISAAVTGKIDVRGLVRAEAEAA
jgi:type I restriction enzyme S subunit